MEIERIVPRERNIGCLGSKAQDAALIHYKREEHKLESFNWDRKVSQDLEKRWKMREIGKDENLIYTGNC